MLHPMIKKFFLSVLALFLLFEEWLWEILTALGRRLAVWLHLQKFEAWLAQTTPPVAAIAFLIPIIIVTPINLIAFWMIAQGIIVRGIVLEIFAKILGTVLIARVFALTKPQLMTIGWFNRLYTLIMGWLNWAHERIRATAMYQNAKRFKAMLKETVRNWLGK